MREMRDSGVGYLGEIPAEWGVVPVRAIWSEVRRPVETGEPEDLLSVSEYYGVDYRKNRIGESGTLMRAESLQGYQICEPGNLVMNIMLAWKGAQGVSQCRGLVSPSYAVFKPADEIEPRFYHYLFRSSLYTDAFRLHSTGLIDSRLRLYPHVFIRMRTVLPPLPEQRRIADWLDERCVAIDAAVEAARASIDEYQAYKKSVISHAVTRGLDPDAPLKDTGIPWLGQVPEGWEISKLSALAGMCGGATPSKSRADYWDGDIPWVSSKEVKADVLYDTSLHISEEGLGSCNTVVVPAGTYVMVVRSGILKHTIPIARLAVPMAINQDIKALQFADELTGKFFSYFVRGMNDSLLLEYKKDGTTVDNLNISKLYHCPVPLPTQEEQRAIADYLDSRTAAIDAVVAQKRAIVEDLLAYKKSLIYEAVTGKREV